MYEFDYLRAENLRQAVEALEKDGAQLLAGGQTLIPTLRQRLAAPSTLISISHLSALRGIQLEGQRLTIGAGTTHSEINTSDKVFPALAELAGKIGDPAVRHRGTIGGSLANNDPSADYPAAFLAVGTHVETSGRKIQADDFFSGLFETALEPGEIITAVAFDVPEAATYVKIDQPASRFALVGVFAAMVSGNLKISVTGVSQDGVFRWTEAEDLLSTDAQADLARAELDEDSLISDIHADATFRAHLTRVATRRAVAEMQPQANSAGEK
jgi:carbon-monoxide dehydrogenase medium subunit